MAKAIGYILDANGYYRQKWYFELTARKIAMFIRDNKSNNLIITDQADNLICTTLPFGFLDRMGDDYINFRDELLEQQLEWQLGSNNLGELKFKKDSDHNMIETK
ncbi:hypothetical protein [Breznakia pachnodae]|uniref:Uncharacterized protein n=1 Tax=Breznakia pachnodae TaxID=265178 RepID=A0ABU0E6G7_9FIRM|nr:hypothetical protein [Breznakia pachnodae]MDQ0362504.1 hypothetical protein [Breznakia pachnodae]